MSTVKIPTTVAMLADVKKTKGSKSSKDSKTTKLVKPQASYKKVAKSALKTIKTDIKQYIKFMLKLEKELKELSLLENTIDKELELLHEKAKNFKAYSTLNAVALIDFVKLLKSAVKETRKTKKQPSEIKVKPIGKMTNQTRVDKAIKKLKSK